MSVRASGRSSACDNERLCKCEVIFRAALLVRRKNTFGYYFSGTSQLCFSIYSWHSDETSHWLIELALRRCWGEHCSAGRPNGESSHSFRLLIVKCPVICISFNERHSRSQALDASGERRERRIVISLECSLSSSNSSCSYSGRSHTTFLFN